MTSVENLSSAHRGESTFGRIFLGSVVLALADSQLLDWAHSRDFDDLHGLQRLIKD